MACPRAMVVVAILRRIAYTLLALFRSVTQRSDENRAMPWRRLIGHIKNTLVAATAEQLQGLRRHRLSPLPTSPRQRPGADGFIKKTSNPLAFLDQLGPFLERCK